MKKGIIISVLALCFSIVTLHAGNLNKSIPNYQSASKFKVSPFCVSIAKGDFDIVKKLVELGADVNQKSEGMTPVMYAAKYNRTDILKLLIANGADLRAKSDKGMTALKYAELHKAEDAKAILEDALKNK
jgi:ankyrin repeat protein